MASVLLASSTCHGTSQPCPWSVLGSPVIFGRSEIRRSRKVKDPQRIRMEKGTSGKQALSRAWRTEEHKSELQSLMRISNAVFFLKKKKKTKAALAPQTP